MNKVDSMSPDAGRRVDDDPFHRFRAKNLHQRGLAAYIPVDGVEVKLLDGCNRSCIFCVNEDYAGKRLNPLDTVKFNESLFSWLDDASEVEKPTAVYGTGGEPLMALDLVEQVFAPLGLRGITTRLVTNGTLLNAENIERLVRMKLTGVKVTFNTAQNDRLIALMRGSHHGDTERILDHIRMAKSAGLWVFVRVGLGRHNYDEVATIYRMLREIGIDVLQIKPWVPSGFAAKNQDELCLAPQDLFDTFARLAQELAGELCSGGPEVTVSCYPPARELGFIVKDCANVAKIYCEPCGHALICNFASEYLGSWYPENGGLSGCVERRRQLYSRIMDNHGVASCPARYNWSQPSNVVNLAPAWKTTTVPIAMISRKA